MPLTVVPPSMVAAVVTSLEMLERPRPRPAPAAPFRLARWKAPSTAKYRALFRRIGEPWLWFSRLVMAEEDLEAVIGHPEVEIHAVEDRHGIEIGLLELDFRQPGEAQIVFFGLVPELAGKGHGGWLMAQTLALGWRRDLRRLWVHTCTLDHPGALGFYRRHGFVPFARAVETFADPRLAGILPREAAPHVPLLDQRDASVR
ncbi:MULTISPECIES: GNAT family N-acetyltransferase [unclassified Sphingomonas]|uniref:GNAT family N-acetyltransferase n=1 Tax=unclassified Sphingomonas TaxID=196159 RepID=UPI0006F8F0C4|nr:MULTISPECIES: GNAT family N-acetyltransferase [unclassified Sphingomonas]KQX26374.1 GCN5 family acetyltransferase [Sphingomonas sp. Root1294]KQY69445.1 GCN5 family acetyltransferase [Sphingomonas sp. Root50]KRB89852.1 GCN5 family acetyltransferase [Sphingomonas sp. Root720]